MKIKIPKLKKNFKKEKIKIKPDLYWKFIVILFFLLLIITTFFAISLFKKIDKREEPSFEYGNTIIEKEKKEKIKNTLDYFQQREEKSKEIINSPSSVVDPSL